MLVCVLLAPLCITLSSPSAIAAQLKCQKFNFNKLFYADYKSGTHWDNSSGVLQITWSTQSVKINDEVTNRSFTDNERTWLRAAFKSWDSALSTVEFLEVLPTDNPQISIGYVALNPQNLQPDAYGFWTSWATAGSRNKATIKLKVSEAHWFSKKNQFIHSVQHELGNVLGLGDITPTDAFASVLEDPWQPPYGRTKLSNTDIALIKQLYGENRNCT